MSTSPDLFSNAINLNRFSNSVAKRIARTYNDLILDSVDQLRGIDELAAPSVKAARLRSILAQLKGSLDGWAGSSTLFATEELQGLAELETGFAVGQLKKELPAQFADEIASVQIDPQFAKSVATVDPTALNVVSLSDDLQAAVSGSPQTFRLTAAQGSTITLPNGKVIEKSFRGLAESQADLFSMKVRNGLLTGEPIDRIAKDLKGRLQFGQPAMSLRQMQQAGGQLTSMANHQVSTIVRTSVNQVANASSQQVYKANQDVTKKYEYLATLDGRTSPICRSLDGQTFVYGQGPTPPQHFNCRSTTKPIIDYKGLGIEPPPEDTRASASGPVPEGMTYGEWLKAQPLKTKQEVLGASKVKYFEKLSERVGPTKAIRMFVSKDGSELTLAQLKAKTDRMKPKVTPKAAAQAKEKAAKVKAEQAAKVKAAAAVKAKEAAAAKAKAEAQQKAAQAKAAAVAKAKQKAKLTDKPTAKKPTTNFDVELSLVTKELKALTPELLKAKIDPKVLETAKKLTAKKNKLLTDQLSEKAKSGKVKDVLFEHQSKLYKEYGFKTEAAFDEAKQGINDWTNMAYTGLRNEQLSRVPVKNLTAYETGKVERWNNKKKLGDVFYDYETLEKNLDTFVKNAPKYQGEVLRGNALDSVADAEAMIKSVSNGRRTPTYDSWTTNPDQAQNFFEDGEVGILWRMNNKTGVPIAAHSRFQKESEVLMPRGNLYDVKNVKKTLVEGQTVFEVTLEQVSP